MQPPQFMDPAPQSLGKPHLAFQENDNAAFVAVAPPRSSKEGRSSREGNFHEELPRRSSKQNKLPWTCICGVVCLFCVIGGIIGIVVLIMNTTGCSRHGNEDDCLEHYEEEDGGCRWPEFGECGCVGDMQDTCEPLPEEEEDR